MKLDPPLAYLVKRCEAHCVAACCGVDAFDFSPIHIGSFLATYYSGPCDEELARQLAELRAQFGTSGACTDKVTFDDLNQRLSARQVDDFVDELLANLAVALDLVAQSEARRAPGPKLD